MVLRFIALASLFVVAPAHAADGGLLSRLVGQRFVIPDARAAPVELEFAAPARDVVEVRVGGAAIERYVIGADGAGKHIHPDAPGLVSQAAFQADSWSRTYRGQTVTYSLSPGGDLVGRRSGALDDWQSPTFLYALNPRGADLEGRLRSVLERAHEEAERWEGHDHGHDHEGQ
ncbi:hypothetical protein [Phenylobacterium sp.]|uniref:hypothetical protein n=1 Tax=Phenylobacterium sp. TaxID=1871053 RepID=UPI002FDF8451